MGIDVYMTWEGRPKDCATFTDGASGYLRESYGRDHYATWVLVPEGFNEDSWDDGGAPIPARLMADRAEAAVHAAHQRYPDDDDYRDRHVANLLAFIELAKAKERETGEPVRVTASY